MFAQESVMDIQNIVTEQDIETLDAEIAAMTAAFTEEHYLNNDEAEHLEMIAAKSMVLGELYERAKWQAKAQAVPEGFVLVNKKDLVKVLNCVTDDWLVDTDSFEEFKKIESLVQDEVNAMIEAQEPTND